MINALPRWKRHKQELSQVLITRCAQLRGRPLEIDPPVVKDHEDRLFGFLIAGGLNPSEAAIANRFVCGHIHRVTNLVRHDNRGDLLQIAELDDFVVDRRRNDRIEPGRRIVKKHQRWFCGHRARDRDAATLSPDSSDGIRSV